MRGANLPLQFYVLETGGYRNKDIIFMLAALSVGVLRFLFGFFMQYFRMLVELFNLLMEPLSTNGLGV
jgi:hypothetical protein